VQLLHRGEAVVFDRLDQVFVEGAHFAGDAKGAVLGMPPGAAGDLGQLVRVKRAHPAAVELGGGGKGRVLDVEVQAHADGVGRHQVIHVAVLVERDLRVPGAGGKRAHDDRAAALLAADQLGNRIDVFHRKADDGRPFRHPADLL
jgi:hypothetical protein